MNNNRAEAGGPDRGLTSICCGGDAYGGGLYRGSNSETKIENCTITANAVVTIYIGGSTYGAGIYCDINGEGPITNCILWSNIGAQMWLEPGNAPVSYSDVQGGWPGPGNIDADPRFVSGPDGDYYLSQIAAGQAVDSPCLDAGSELAANLGMDIYTTRTDEVGDTGIVDMGYHYHSPVIIEYGNPDIDGDGDVDFMDYSWLSMGLFYEPSKQIPMGSVVVDGDLSDWPGSVEWIELDKVYDGSPSDLIEARFALQWDANTNKVYAAVVVNDTNHLFLDEYVTWDASDRIEVYSQGDAEDGAGWNMVYDVAQQYYVAPDTSGGYWATWAESETLGGDEGLEYAVDVNGAKIIYEVGVRQFDNYGGFSGEETLVTDLHAGHVVGFDIVACTRWDTTNFGMLSENLMMGKYNDAGKFGKYILVDKIFSADMDGNGANNYADLGIFFESWMDCYVTEASDPIPANEARGVDPNGTLGWVPGEGELYHDVYLGTDDNAMANAGHGSPEFMGTVSAVNFDPCGLELETTYYWRIDEVGPACTTQGKVWKFKTWIEPIPGLISLWEFDEGNGTTAHDSVSKNHGTINGATWTTGQIDGALSFDGVNDYVDMADTVKDYLGTNYTVSAWIKADTISNNKAILSYRHSTEGNPVLFFLGQYYTNVDFAVRDNSHNLAQPSFMDAITANTWYHVAGVREGNNVNVYVNGVSGNPVSETLGAISPDNLKIGANQWGGNPVSNHFDGAIDDVRIYNRALTAGEILELYQDGLN
jgi:hypothetical protein